jgi:hypothetical protein
VGRVSSSSGGNFAGGLASKRARLVVLIAFIGAPNNTAELQCLEQTLNVEPFRYCGFQKKNKTQYLQRLSAF